jgi:hypothetical protein
MGLYIYFSGTPYRNQTYATRMKRIGIIFSIWTLCLLPKSILFFTDLLDLTDKSTDKTNAIGLFLI